MECSNRDFLDAPGRADRGITRLVAAEGGSETGVRRAAMAAASPLPYADASTILVAGAFAADAPVGHRSRLSSTFEASAIPAVMSDPDGWICFANVSACRRLAGSSERSLASLPAAPFTRGLLAPRLVRIDATAELPTPVHVNELLSIATPAGRAVTLRGGRQPQAGADAGALTVNLHDALRRNALSVQYQPQYDLRTGHGCGVEALARWVLSTGEIIAPSVFIVAAERAGLIQDLGAWVLNAACASAASWCGSVARPATLAVNVSALQIDERFAQVISRTLKQAGFAAQQLEIEITESALITNTELAIEYLNEWRRLGVRIAVDDFGAGYSSLSYLSRLPLDRLKLDQSLVHGLTSDHKSAAIIRCIVALGAELGIGVIAEGIETELQCRMLTDLGCPQGQGYLFGRPMPANQAQVVLRKSWGNRPMSEPHPAVLAAGQSRG